MLGTIRHIPISSQNPSATSTLTLKNIYYFTADTFQDENVRTHYYMTILLLFKKKQRRLNGFALTQIYYCAKLLTKAKSAM